MNENHKKTKKLSQRMTDHKVLSMIEAKNSKILMGQEDLLRRIQICIEDGQSCKQNY